MKNFKVFLRNEDYDLRAWRDSVEGVKGFEEGVEILDKYGGWKLLEGCLRESPSKRISASAAAGSCRVDGCGRERRRRCGEGQWYRQ